MSNFFLSSLNDDLQISAITGEKYTFAEVKDTVWRIASGLTKHGFRDDDRILIISENSCEYILMFHAVLSLAGTVTMANPHYLAGMSSRQQELSCE